jgi:NAD(P)-dependent dehydrogenase (short-subunit alcohol dehydrogenase family)
VIISGRRKTHLACVAKANPGIEAVELDIADPDSIERVATKLIAEHPDLNVLINNAADKKVGETIPEVIWANRMFIPPPPVTLLSLRSGNRLNYS